MKGIFKSDSSEGLTVRLACEKDLDDVENMITDFVKGHPAETHMRSRSALREAYFGDVPVANLLVAVKHGRIVGMGQWTRIYDMFWSMYGADIEWLYVRPEYRGRGVVVAIVAEICAQVRRAGGEFLRGGGDGDAQRLYERVAIGSSSHDCHLSAEAFQVFADLAGLTPREIVRRLPSLALNRVPRRSRT
jgi:GNAT superfamily N-acetyltransferase